MWLFLSIIVLGAVMGSDIAGSSDMKIRLVEGPHPCSGRVEVLLYGLWGTVCDDGWGIKEAMVVCKELGCGAAVSATREAQFGTGSLSTGLSDIRCRGTESALSQCPASLQREQHCTSEEAAGVVCHGEFWGSDPVRSGQLKIRLVEGPDECYGRVELLHNGVWGTICGKRWGIKEAGVVCQQIDCGIPSLQQNQVELVKGTGPIWLDDVHCRGTESSLYQCSASPWGMHDCDHIQAAGVVCSGVRLVGGPTPCSGRVEVFHNKKWGTVCDNGWDMEDARVVCREWGCGGEPLTAATGTKFGEGSGPIWMDQVNCMGGEYSLKECPKQNIIDHTCDHRKDAGVECSEIHLAEGRDRCAGRVELFRGGIWATVRGSDWDLKDAAVVCRYLGCGTALFAPQHSLFGMIPVPTPFWFNGILCTGTETSISECNVRPQQDYGGVYKEPYGLASVICTELRLVNGSNPCSGRVEVFHNEKWGTVCDAGWDLQDAEVVCRELNCGHALKASGGASFGRGTGPIWLKRVNCTGREESLRQCSKLLWGEHNCDHSHDASVECAELRLVNGSNPFSGRVEVLHNQQWGTVCDAGWDSHDAQVVCRERSGGNVAKAFGGARYGQGTGPILLKGVNCTGEETSLRECAQSTLDNHSCDHSQDASVECSGKVRLVNGSSLCSGRVEILDNQQWQAVCDHFWDIKAARVVCREMGCGDALWVPERSHFGRGLDPIRLFFSYCDGIETSLLDCFMYMFGGDACLNDGAASVKCSGNGIPIYYCV
ncbi:deleted in malignant brain tumors 1 protein-like isoform X2 [Sceloporus undulatus]|uniref:deleted in malignant brain tumors 1 protein-like isoform X2 n=1 Tax=Sceloporus undulatus TaxID=8520 RepID=UPI001C4C64C8|nr:deleted in malignant brain tumors 1 protein-like isoform X2 [Sceloporus undulatus]